MGYLRTPVIGMSISERNIRNKVRKRHCEVCETWCPNNPRVDLISYCSGIQEMLESAKAFVTKSEFFPLKSLGADKTNRPVKGCWLCEIVIRVHRHGESSAPRSSAPDRRNGLLVRRGVWTSSAIIGCS